MDLLMSWSAVANQCPLTAFSDQRAASYDMRGLFPIQNGLGDKQSLPQLATIAMKEKITSCVTSIQTSLITFHGQSPR